ncbi:MAG: acyl-CoA dehydratase activase [Candidatus Eremiobacteraeota bacterium]|nr:acyl-CoA dehydratase activase [Candidatus Eremiobacteraeota bacterium]
MGNYLGLDIGSISVKLAIIDDESNIVYTNYKRHLGRPSVAAIKIIEELAQEIELSNIRNATLTGIGASVAGKSVNISSDNEIICQGKAASIMYPDIRSIIEMGGQDSKLILLDYDRNIGEMVIRDFAMNTICAAGTGSFLDQQASRLGVSIEKEFGELALKSEKPPRIAGRCSVFAKTDMIHLQQEATPVHDIVAGLCFAVARNFVSGIAKGKKIVTPVAFHGGVASNSGMTRAFREVLGIADDSFRIHELHKEMGAIGAAIIAKEKSKGGHFNFKDLEKFLSRPSDSPKSLPPLKIRLSRTSRSPEKGHIPQNGDKITGFLGVDVGSISTNLAVIDEKGKLLSKRYLMTAGRPIEAVRQGLLEIGGELAGRVKICGVSTTGSGRYLTGDFLGADVVRNEITAQATGAIDIDTRVDTIFEIGGQDSKYISLENGAIVDFEMNKVCAAGTGSFLEEQAEKLNINIKKEFGKKALKAKRPCAMGERCTVFIESDIVSNQQKGASCEDLVSGLSYSIVYNYLNKVVADKKVGDHIFFQGGTAFNNGVVAAFEAVTGKKITVPDNHEVTGAIGCAIIALKWHQETGKKTTFRGFDLSKREYVQDTFECKGCSNHCEIKRVRIEGEKPLYYGGRCEKYEQDRKSEKSKGIPDLFKEREDLLLKEYDTQKRHKLARGIVGIPRIMYFFEHLPFWVRFFKELGYQVVLSDPTNKQIINDGVEHVLSETCFPIKISHGHVLNLMEKNIDFLFIPSILNMKKVYEGFTESITCPYGQALPYILNIALDLDRQDKVKVLKPIISFSRGTRGVVNALKEIAFDLGVHYREISKAVKAAEEAQEEFCNTCQKRGIEILSNIDEDDNAIVIISRPYNGCDPGLNLNIPKKLRDLGALAIPMEFLPLDDVPLDKDWPFMTWRYGQKILAASDIVRDDKRLNALYITNFGCGPDSFLTRFFKKRMGGKVFLQIEVDEHSAGAGVITRCEAFLDSLGNIRNKSAKKYVPSMVSIDRTNGKRTLFIPNMCDHARAVRAAFLSAGIPSEVLPESSMESLYWGRKFTTGKECYPCIVTTGDMVKLINTKGFDADKAAFFMPTAGGGCRFGYYNLLQRIILEELGRTDIPIYSPNQTDSFLEDIGAVGGDDFFRTAWRSIVGVDILIKVLHETRPYEIEKGQADGIYKEYLLKLCNATMKKENVIPVLKDARKAFDRIPVDREKVKPVIGIVGEIFVRLNRFANNHLVENLEKLGAEVWVAPFSEWIFYLNNIRKEDFLEDRDYLGWLRLTLEDTVARRDEHAILKPFETYLRSGHEPSIEENIKMGSAYVHPSYRGESILSIGKAVDYYRSGLSGVINVMPFTCMPGNVVQSVLKRVKEDCENIPILTIAYDGLDMTNNNLRLEAFVHQCSQFLCVAK